MQVSWMASRSAFGQLFGNRFCFFSTEGLLHCVDFLYTQKACCRCLFCQVWSGFSVDCLKCLLLQSKAHTLPPLPGEAVKDITVWKKVCLFLLTCVFVPRNTVLFSLQMYILIVCLTFLESLKMQNWHRKQATSAGRGLCLFWNYCSIRRNLDVRRHWYLRFLTCWAGNRASITWVLELSLLQLTL